MYFPNSSIMKKPTRSLSGVSVVAVMTKPFPCPHGRCDYCPGGPESGSPQSYTGKEPAARRGAMNNYDPYKQVTNRLQQYVEAGHEPEKIELIVMGGTFPSFPVRYQTWFVKKCLQAMNEFKGKKSRGSLERIQEDNEKSRVRCVGMTFETRPDWCGKKEINRMLRYGGTRIELGVQTTYDKVLKNVSRGHGMEQTKKATRLARDAGFKICYHMMLGLPDVSEEMDVQAFMRIFESEDYRPDMLKIYPTLVIKGTKLYKMWKNGEYEPLTTEKAVGIINRIVPLIPPWVRIMRVQRDIPTNLVDAGVMHSNLRQMTEEKCRCIRCREVGLKAREGIFPEKIERVRRDYEAHGKEIFLSFEDKEKDVLIGLLRMRFPKKSHRKEIDKDTAVIRELHVYGPATPVGKRGRWQHRGYGKKLLGWAEEIAKKNKKKALVVISGIGTREYYRGMGYSRKGPYMWKQMV
jgi:elongator complex protein 3